MVLADSSIVILALPEILVHYNVSINDVAWVLTLFNLVLAIVAVPAAHLARRRAPAAFCRVGLVVFAAASLGCAVAPSFSWLLASRGVQAIGGAAAICAALELLPSATGSERRAIAVWSAAGVIGAAAGPAIGGILTDTISWKAIFAVQVPLALVALVFIPRSEQRPLIMPAADRPDVPANVALGLVSASLTAALFLIVLLLINGWGHTPLEAAGVVTVMPLAALAIYRLLPAAGSPKARAAGGAVLIGGGLLSLAVLPGASWWWLVLPQIAIGAGLALAISALTATALAGRSPLGIHGGWTIAARHAGICIGLLILTPIFTNQLDTQAAAAEASATKLVLESSLSISDKIDLGGRLADLVGTAPVTKPPNLDSAFKPLGNSPEVRQLHASVTDQIERAVTRAFSLPFALAAVMALLALVPLAFVKVRVRA
jgi:MFS family permease